MSNEPLLNESRESSMEMNRFKTGGGPGDIDQVNSPEGVFGGSAGDANEPALSGAGAIPSRKQRISDLFTILCAGCALISDGYANSLMTLVNVVLDAQYPKQYVSAVSTRVSNALLVGEICGQISIGYARYHRHNRRIC